MFDTTALKAIAKNVMDGDGLKLLSAKTHFKSSLCTVGWPWHT